MSNQDCWDDKDDVVLFWEAARPCNLRLSQLGRRIFSTPANLVSSERVFLMMNLLHNKQRNRITSERANKLEFIYINSRVLEYMPKRSKPCPAPPLSSDAPPPHTNPTRQPIEEIEEPHDIMLLTEDQELGLENLHRAGPDTESVLGKRKRDGGEAEDSDLEELPGLITLPP